MPQVTEKDALSQAVKPAWRFGPRILVPMILVMLAVAGLAAIGLNAAASQSDAVSVERQILTTQRAIDDSIARLALEQETVAVWDETVDHVARPHPDLAWLNDNTGAWLHNIHGHDRTFILGPRDEPIYANEAGRMVPAARFEALRPSLGRMIDEVRGRTIEANNRFDRHPGQPRPGTAVLTTDRAVHDTQMVAIAGRPAAVSVMLIRTSTPALRRPGPEPVMISIRFLDQGFLRELENRNLIARPRFSRSAVLAAGEQSLPLESEDGGVIGYFIWRPELPGSSILKMLAPTTAATILAMIALMALLAFWLRRSTGQLHQTLAQLRASEAQAQHLAFHDTLTGLPNRALFRDRLDHALSHARRGTPLSILLLDLDRFKRINDTLGHLAGDELIREFAARLSELVRDQDTVARLSGDEFAILLPGIASPAGIDAICERILVSVRERFQLLGNSAFVGVSIGVISAPDAGLDRAELLRKADIALYRAKAEGRDRYMMFSDGMDERVQFRSAVEEDLRAALQAGDQLVVHYQPEMGNDGRSIVGLEALVRWQHPVKGLVPPEQFVPVAEETGLIDKLGEWVLGEACKAAHRWPHLFIAVNLSPVQFRTGGFADRLIALVREARVSPKQIELEVTEGVLLDDDALVHAALGKLRAAGFRIALDDFGTGYSSFSYLRRFKFDKIKIDRSFIQHLGHQVDSAALVTAVVTIGHAMGMVVVAEGVETREQKNFLAGAGCNQMQGYLFSRALPQDEVDRLLSTHESALHAA
jgi:diguanylate cyclase (GGDEF)-like protein